MIWFLTVAGLWRAPALGRILGGKWRWHAKLEEDDPARAPLATHRPEEPAVPDHPDQAQPAAVPESEPSTEPIVSTVNESDPVARPVPEADDEQSPQDVPAAVDPDLERILLTTAPPSEPVVLGIDIGGTGIKGAPVNVTTGALTADRFRLATPQPATPEAIAAAVAEIVRHFEWTGLVGCTFPAVVKRGVVCTAANVDPSWIGVDGQTVFERATGCPFVVLNDADAAGIAEMEFGAGADEYGVVIVVTLGTGIGSALFVDRRLVPNTELGHLEIRGKDAERRASERTRERKGWGWRRWGSHVNEYLQVLERLFSPDLIIIGGGVSRKWEKFVASVTVETRVVPATLLNDAGIVGAARAASAFLGFHPVGSATLAVGAPSASGSADHTVPQP
jgi:polyphosphate glucokinase